jgi:hypothetical protein
MIPTGLRIGSRYSFVWVPQAYPVPLGTIFRGAPLAGQRVLQWALATGSKYCYQGNNEFSGHTGGVNRAFHRLGDHVATVQNKMHWATHGHTSTEVIIKQTMGQNRSSSFREAKILNPAIPRG